VTVPDYTNLIVAYRNGAPVRLGDVAKVVDSAENVKLGAWANMKPAIILNVQRQPGANVIATVDAIKERLPELQASLPPTCRWTCCPTAPPASAPRSSTCRSSWCWPCCWWCW
jgi:multidrug efflux pump